MDRQLVSGSRGIVGLAILHLQDLFEVPVSLTLNRCKLNAKLLLGSSSEVTVGTQPLEEGPEPVLELLLVRPESVQQQRVV